ncbi:MAG: GH3 auxin-responsive promoter family protein [Candidatus Nomurabacteria bacterium]|nr:GH3 auxin-responsive promoter family protein [Candidatus Nomurabacteria bacterium]
MPIDPLSFMLVDFAKTRVAQVNLRDKRAKKTQSTALFYLVKRAQETRFGKAHFFEQIQDVKDFQKNVPIAHYIDLKKDIEDMMNGMPDILWPDKVKYFAKSSATTSESKYIPVTRVALTKNHFKGGKDLISFYLQNNPSTHVLSSKIISLCGTLSTSQMNNSIRVGDISAIIVENLPLYVKLFKFPGPELSLRDGWEEKIEEISTLAINQNITCLAGAPIWVSILIKKVLEKSGKKSIFEVWPNLEVFMHGGISFKPYRKVFDELFKGGNVKYMESYNASEGYFAIQDDLTKPNEMRLMLDYGVFYEFIPLEKYQNKNYEALTIDEVEINKNYVIVITTNGGLWRYVIGDTVMFTSLSPYRIKITGRTKQYMNLYDEELTVDNAEEAISYASHVTDARITDYTLAPTMPDKDGRGCHEWIIEFSKPPSDIKKFTEELDKKLQECNGDYFSRRVNDVVMSLPIVHVASTETFYNWMKSKDRLGGQFKVPRISNSRENLESILAFLK